MSEILEIQPFTKPVQATANIPGSKSITNRALILAALNNTKVQLKSALFSDDTKYMCECLEQLGFILTKDESEKSISIQGLGGNIPKEEAELFVGNAGTAARFLTAFLATRDKGTYHLDGTEAMRKRPMKGLLEFLSNKGTEFIFHQEEWHFPFTMKTHELSAGNWQVDASESSQILSALMMVAPYSDGDVTLKLIGDTVSKPFVKMTVDMMKQFHCEVIHQNDSYHIPANSKYSYNPPTYSVEPDATAASYFFTLPFICGGEIKVCNLNKRALQGDTGFLDIIQQLGFNVKEDSNCISVQIEANQKLQGGDYDFNPISDTFLTLAAISPLFEKKLLIQGIAHTRKQETDRVHAMATELKKLGQEIIESEDSLEIHPSKSQLIEAASKKPIIHTYEDHRVSMSFAILGSYDLLGNGQAWLRIDDPYCCAKTFPNFYDELERIRLS